MNIVIVGHVDHGKSTFIGRLLADTGSLPEGKLAQIKAVCERNSKPFEYAFLLDALKDEQAQGITIDTARSFFKTKKRHYIIIDAPGHIEFLKNMITGAARAEAGLLIIDAKEGVKENSRRHGYMLSLLGIKQIIVLVNKMDLVNYSEQTFIDIKNEYSQFLNSINVIPITFVPISAFEGQNLMEKSSLMPWYTAKDVLSLIDDFKKAESKENAVFRFPVQDIYKFTQSGDDRRIFAGTIESGKISVGDDVVFYPSKKESRIKSIEKFNAPVLNTVLADEAIGFTLETQIYVQRGELMCKKSETEPFIAQSFKANIFWLGKKPLEKNKKYKLKSAAFRGTVYLDEILNVIDASDLSSLTNKNQVGRHDVAECIFQTTKLMSFDTGSQMEGSSRFVIIDDYEIAGGGVIVEAVQSDESPQEKAIRLRDENWVKSVVSPSQRQERLQQKGRAIVFMGNDANTLITAAKALEKQLFEQQKMPYFYGQKITLSSDLISLKQQDADREESLKQVAEMAHLFSHAGFIFITSISQLENYELELLKKYIDPFDLVVVSLTNKDSDNTKDTVESNYSIHFDQNTDITQLVSSVADELHLIHNQK